MRSFTNFKNGQTILQATLTQLIQYYHRFHKIMLHDPFKHLTARTEMLSIHILMNEIKKHKPTFWRLVVSHLLKSQFFYLSIPIY